MTKEKTLTLKGVIPIIPTPFNENEEIDFSGLIKLLDFAHSAGAQAVCLPAYASEFYKLSDIERQKLISAAVKSINRRIPVLAQVNHVSVKNAIELAKFAKQEGADCISTAVPRLFAITEDDIFEYFTRLLSAVDIPFLIQDFNPGGATISSKFISRLHKEFPHFQYVKLEEPLMASKVKAIIEETNGEIGVIEGWGGMFMLELIPAGICGIMPDLALTDLLSRIFSLACEDKKEKAYEIFQGVLPQIVFSLQNMEFFHLAEKLLLQARGVMAETTVRSLKVTTDKHNLDHINFINNMILNLLDKQGLSHNYK